MCKTFTSWLCPIFLICIWRTFSYMNTFDNWNKKFEKNCPIWEEKISEEKPKYIMRKDYFIAHQLTHGPNNQIKDFRSGIYFAIKLNRTLLPR